MSPLQVGLLVAGVAGIVVVCWGIEKMFCTMMDIQLGQRADDDGEGE